MNLSAREELVENIADLLGEDSLAVETLGAMSLSQLTLLYVNLKRLLVESLD